MYSSWQRSSVSEPACHVQGPGFEPQHCGRERDRKEGGVQSTPQVKPQQTQNKKSKGGINGSMGRDEVFVIGTPYGTN